MARPSLQPPALTGNTYSVVQRVRFLGQFCQFSHYVNNGQAAADKLHVQGDQSDIDNWWTTLVIPPLKALLSVGTEFHDLRIYCLTWPDVATQKYEKAPLTGTVAGDPLPPQIAYVISKITSMRGKSGRGRMFICGMSENDSTNGAPTAAFTTRAGDLAVQFDANFVGAITGRTFHHVVVALQKYKADSLLPAVPPAPPQPKPPPLTVCGSEIREAVPVLIWNTQRSRTIGRGE